MITVNDLADGDKVQYDDNEPDNKCLAKVEYIDHFKQVVGFVNVSEGTYWEGLKWESQFDEIPQVVKYKIGATK